MKFITFLILIIFLIININYNNCICADKKKQIRILLLEPRAVSNDQINLLFKHIRDKLNEYEQFYIFSNDEIENVSDDSIRAGKERIKYLDKRLNIDKCLRIFINQSEDSIKVIIYSTVHPFEQTSTFASIESAFSVNNFNIQKSAQEIKNRIVKSFFPTEESINKKKRSKLWLGCALALEVVIVSAIFLYNENIMQNKNKLPDPPDFP